MTTTTPRQNPNYTKYQVGAPQWSPQIVNQTLPDQGEYAQLIDSTSKQFNDLLPCIATQNNISPIPTTWVACVDPGASPLWFEVVHLFPTEANLGNVTADQSIQFEIYNAYREENRSLTSITDNTFGGVTISGLTPPLTLFSQSGRLFTLDVSRIGEPTIGGEFIFVLDVPDITLPVSGTRLIFVAEFTPQSTAGLRETFTYQTQIIQALDGTEQRIALRRFPRRVIRHRVMTTTPRATSKFEIFLNEWQANVFGVTLFSSSRRLTAAVSAGASQVPITTDQNVDFKIGGLCMVVEYAGDGTAVFDALTVNSLGSPENVLGFNTNLLNSYTTQALAVPIYPAIISGPIRATRFPSGVTMFDLQYEVIDNEFSYAAQTKWSTYNSRLLIDDASLMDSTREDTFIHAATRLDFDVGLIEQQTGQLTGVQSAPRGFRIESPYDYFEIRRLFQQLRGGQVAFYQPTGLQDFQLLSDVTIGAANIDVSNVEYFLFNTNSDDPKRHIRIVLNDGTTMLHEVVGSTEISATTERISISPTAPQSYTVAEVNRIEFLILSRFADSVSFDHRWFDGGEGLIQESTALTATIGVPNA